MQVALQAKPLLPGTPLQHLSEVQRAGICTAEATALAEEISQVALMQTSSEVLHTLVEAITDLFRYP